MNVLLIHIEAYKRHFSQNNEAYNVPTMVLSC